MGNKEWLNNLCMSSYSKVRIALDADHTQLQSISNESSDFEKISNQTYP